MAISEIKAITILDNTLAQLDESECIRVLRWAWGKYASKSHPEEISIAPSISETPEKKTTKQAGSKKKSKGKTTLTIVKDLNLRQEGKKFFTDFVTEKKPSSNIEKCVVAVYYLKNILKIEVTKNHVFTCYKNAKWRLPADLDNTLRYTACDKGWLDTSSMMDIKLTPEGENFVEFDLPQKSKDSKK